MAYCPSSLVYNEVGGLVVGSVFLEIICCSPVNDPMCWCECLMLAHCRRVSSHVMERVELAAQSAQKARTPYTWP